MDTELLVEQKDDGQRLIEQLTRDGLKVSVAFWVRISDEGPWRLYISSPMVEEEQPTEAYRNLYTALDKISSRWVSPAVINLLNDHHPIARAAIEVRDRHPGRLATEYQGRQLGGLAIKEAYIYPEIAPLRISFTITYYRKDNSNWWRAVIRRGNIYRGMHLLGAVSYSTAQWEGETKGDQRFASVLAFVGVDPKYDRPDILDDPEMRKLTADQARMMADEMFRTHHPDASIKYEYE